MEDGETPQLKTFVLIILPPTDNPSFGKIISAFTISDSSSSSIPSQEQESHQNPQVNLPIQLPSSHENQFSSRRYQLGTPKTSLGLLGISLFALILWVCSSPHTLFQTRNLDNQRLRDGEDDDDGKPNSFIFPLYPKLGVREMLQKDIELKLGRFVEFDSDNVVSPFVDDGVRASKIIKAVSAVDSTAILPVKGGIYPDGYVMCDSCSFIFYFNYVKFFNVCH